MTRAASAAMLTERQRIAIADPCHRAFETALPVFRRVAPLRGGWVFSTILTINK